ncbi:MAG: metallophosphoesterase family protein [Deltaproteobacteria bacterium]|nr:metallophosphoesterase family protein [Deltaproteobacteria bacterium]
MRTIRAFTALGAGAVLLALHSACSSDPPPGVSPPPAPPGGQDAAASDSSTDGGVDADAAPAVEPKIVNPSIHNTVLGRPTDSSVAISVLADAAGDRAWVEYGTALDASLTTIVGAKTSPPVTSSSGEPLVIELTGLAKDTLHFYRVHYARGGAGDDRDNLHSFRTQRAKGKTFHFGVQGDTHPERFNNKMFHADLFTKTMEQVRDRQPDLYFTLGDDFSIEKIIENFKAANFGAGHTFSRNVEGIASYAEYQSLATLFSKPMITDGVSAPQGNGAYLRMRKDFFGIMGNATALLLTNGNHEQAHLANLGGIFNNAAVWAADGRLRYYPLPAPGGFYSGDETKLASVNGYPTIAAPDGYLRDYYAFTWGDALFVTIDPYWHSSEVSPDSTLFDEPEPKWGATIGNEQYAWLKKTLESSDAKWKFVFAHHVNGNNRGGAAIVGTQEWGGEPGFTANRPTWPKPIHQLFADTKVTIFFQGHDHMYARERVDGVVYQEVPNPADNSYFAYNCDAYAPPSISWQGPAGYGVYDPSYGVRLPNTGYLDVEVSADGVQVSYVRTYRAVDLSTNSNGIFTGKEVNGEVAFRYSIPPRATDHLAKDFPYTCIGAAPPPGWVYNP